MTKFRDKKKWPQANPWFQLKLLVIMTNLYIVGDMNNLSALTVLFYVSPFNIYHISFSSSLLQVFKYVWM